MATRGFLEQPRNSARIQAMLLEGKGARLIAQALSTKKTSVSVQAVTGYMARHRLEINSQRSDLETQTKGIAIASKRFRLNALEALFVPMYARVLEDGPMIEERDVSPDGEVIHVRYKANPLLMTLGRYLRWAAEEMGQIPRWQARNEGQGYGSPGDVQLAQNVETQNVIIYRGGHDLNMTP